MLQVGIILSIDPRKKNIKPYLLAWIKFDTQPEFKVKLMSKQPNNKFSTKHTWVVGLGAISVSIFINLVILYFAKGFLGIPSDFVPLRGMTVMLFTIIGTFTATLAFWIITRFSKNPIRTFQVVALISLVVSIVPHIRSILNPPDFDLPLSASIIGGLFILFHVAAASVCIGFFSKLTQ